jgi:aerobic-type carbon monoxide dehydrogenase small subunit (CoxS/CutS family)
MCVERDLTVNGETRRVAVAPGDTLLSVLRGTLGLTGAKESCGRGECGACTVLVGGRPVLSCVLLAVEAGDEITTIEGLADTAQDLRESFAEAFGFQCGFCTSGQIVRAEALLRGAAPGSLRREDVRASMNDNICRCTGYRPIIDAVERTARSRGLWAGEDVP